MATITERAGADGTVSFKVQIRIKKAGKIIHNESRTFSKRALAEKWAKGRELELADPETLASAKLDKITVAEVIEMYISLFEEHKRWGRSKTADLKRLMNKSIGTKNAITLTQGEILDYIQERRTECGPATAKNDLIWLGVSMKTVAAAKDLPLAVAAVDAAMRLSKATRLVSKSKERERRPTPEELDKIESYFQRKVGMIKFPMADIIQFAIASSRRLGEICRLRWEDLDVENSTCICRDVKHPRIKWGNHREFKLLNSAMEIIQRQPRTGELIFPFNEKSVSTNFTRACKIMEIEDLHFHDFRHEATCRLFALGYSIQEVQLFTLHESWGTLKRYANLRPRDVIARA